MPESSPHLLSGRLHFLDALRGLAAVGVMLFHFYAVDVSPIHTEMAASLPAWLAGVIGQLYCGVEVFFVLSGFVIAFSMDGNAANLRYAGNFIVRRSLRLDPPYWVAAALMVGYFLCLWPAQWRDYYLMYGGVPGVLANLFYVHNLSFIYPAGSILDVSWTLCLEVQFYLSYLLMLVAGHYAGVVWGHRAAGMRRTVVVAAVAAVAAWSFAYWLFKPDSSFGGRAWMFFLGVGLYGALTRGVPRRAVAVGLVALAALFVWKQQLEGIVTVATASAIFAAGATGRLSTLLAYRPLLHLGKISYSIYLLHMVIGSNLLAAVSARYDGSIAAAWTGYALAIVFSLCGAELLHRWVEAPSNRLSQRLKRARPAKLTLPAPVPDLTSA